MEQQKTAQVGFRITPSRRAVYESLARAQGIKLAEWLRKAAEAEVQRSQRYGEPREAA